jgi:hypothetical protein
VLVQRGCNCSRKHDEEVFEGEDQQSKERARRVSSNEIAIYGKRDFRGVVASAFKKGLILHRRTYYDFRNE